MTPDEPVLALSKVEEVPGIGVWVQFENRVVVRTNVEQMSGCMMARVPDDPKIVMSKNWIIDGGMSEVPDEDYYAQLHEGTDSGTHRQEEALMHCFGDTKTEAEQRVFIKLTAQIERAYCEYAVDPHTGEVVEEPEHIDRKT